ncbi:WXG100-like domain-containing protein, partial [Amycolatopsis oliviviridis]|uniref:WXG100-like domain-containing protein n=1 Tax=Amycolatopsis oliviviridis TaxID=1471590 RepID=UPI00402B087C
MSAGRRRLGCSEEVSHLSNGGVHIPPDVRKFLEFTLGLSWPESDDQGLVALWKAWEAFEDAAGVFEAAARAAGVAVPQVLEGETGEFFAHFLSATIPDGVAGLGEAAGELAKMAQNAAADVYKTKVMFVVFAAFTLASIIHLMATLIGALFTGVVIAAARVALTAIWRALITRMGQLSLSGGLSQATKTALLKFAKDLAIKTGGFAAFGAALMGGTDFGVQARQIADGDRQGWDTTSLTSSLVGGALGGAFAGIFHSAAGGIRSTAFSLRDRLATRHPDDLLADNVTVGQVITTINKPLAALGDAAYATGQMITVIATAPLINLALGAPTGNPALGALGALSRYGGSRTNGTTNGNLDTIHPPEIPDLTIPTLTEKPDTAKEPGTEKPAKDVLKTPEASETPPPYTTLPAETGLRLEKTPAYTTSPHALGTLHTTAAANGAAPTTLSPLSDAASQTALAAGATPERGNRGTATPDTLAPEVGHGSPDGITSVVAGAPPGHRLLTPETAVVSETRPDTSNPARSTSPDTTSSRVQADRTAAPLSTTASLSPALPAARPDTAGGHLAATARAADTVLPDSTRSFLAETAPATTRPPTVPDTLHTPALTDPTPSASMPEPSAITTPRPHDVPASFPIEPVRAIPLPGNGGVAFVPDGYTTNITNAFPHPEPGVFRVVVQHRDNTFALPGHHTLDPAHRPERLIAALQDLPTQLAAWRNYTKIDLLACDLTPTLLDRLTPAIHATFGVELHAPYHQTPLFVAPTGGLSLTDPAIPHTLHLAPKRRRNDTMVADPKAPETSARLAEVSARLLHQYGNLSDRWLSYSIPREIFPQGLFDKQFHLHFKQERENQANSGTLWSPLYRGKSNVENFSKEELNDLTAWVYRKVVADQTSNPAAIAKTAAETGFASSYAKLTNAADAAAEAAAIDGRRHPYLILSKPEHRVKIIALLDRILANTTRRTQGKTLTSLNDLNVHGAIAALRGLITEREQALKDDPALAAASRQLGLPTLRPSGAFLGRFLDVAKTADRGWIDKLAYAAAWEHKTATADELTRLLRDEGITGDPGVLREIVTTVIGEATRQGDRLPLLDATDQGQHAAIHARTAAIVNATPALYASTGTAPVTALVTHMRTRHITGPQHDLETIAQTILETPAEELTQDYSLAPLDLDGLPSAARALGAETEPTGYGPDISPAEEGLASTAKQLLLDFGDLNISYLIARWPNPNRKSRLSFKEMSEHLTTERARLLDSGELWLPTYRGLRNSGKDSHTDDLTAWLYRQVVTDHTKSPTAIASSAAAAGFAADAKQLADEARAVMEAATNDGRRHAYLKAAKPDHRDRIIALIDRILANTPSPTRHQVMNSLHEVNVHGDDKVLQVLVSERRQALQDDPALAEAAQQLGLPTLRPTGTYHGRFLDVANEADQNWIGSLAYAAAWEHKTATVEHLVTLLTQEGIRDTDGALTPLITRILAEADANGDRHTTLSADRPADHTALQRRTGSLVLKNHDELFALEPAQATTRLIRHMRRNHITGTQDTLRNIAHTVYTLPTHQPLPGT